MRFCLLVFLAGCGVTVTEPAPIGQSKDGIISFYDGDGRGACGYDPTNDDFTAIYTGGWASSAACGTCIEVTGPKGVVVVRVVDHCPDCENDHLDLRRSSYAKIANIPDGRATVKWKTVTCPTAGNVQVQVKDGSNPFWLAIQPRNFRRPVVKVEGQKGGAWVTLSRTDYNYFLAESGLGEGPIALKLTADDGTVVEGSLPAVVAGAVVTLNAQF
ncbi:MAG: hypothetical protein JNK82_36505 [Myxococcaceae bacterium]|nr:hypothetical protein [Myxococcaceae bacterium]